jgi:hypothetical protein
MNYSMTFVGIITIVLGLFIEDAQIVSALAGDIVTVIGLAVTWYGRWRQGDVTIVGVK